MARAKLLVLTADLDERTCEEKMAHDEATVGAYDDMVDAADAIVCVLAWNDHELVIAGKLVQSGLIMGKSTWVL